MCTNIVKRASMKVTPAFEWYIDTTGEEPKVTWWKDITKEQSAVFANDPKYKDGHFMFLTGKKTGCIAIDLVSSDCAENIDGVRFWDSNFEKPDTFITKTPVGYCVVYQYNDEVKSGKLDDDVLIDVLSDGEGFVFGPGYEIVNRVLPKPMPQNMIQKMVRLQNRIQVTPSEINAVAGCDLKWEIFEFVNDDEFVLIPHTRICTVNDNYLHSEKGTGRFIINRERIEATCLHHGQRILKGNVADRMLKLFFAGK